MMNKNLKQNLFKTSNSKILSLDGGGIRGILALGILEKLETEIKLKYGKETRLCDYYDIIGGTSTGSIIASGLVIGKSVDEIIRLYKSLGAQIFGKNFFGMLTRGWKSLRALSMENYSSKKLERLLKSSEAFDNITLGDIEKVNCGLVINTKRADTYSLWSVCNHVNGKYYNANKDLKLWELCKASSSAPYYFKPTVLNLKSRNGKLFKGTFIDGGVSLSNNPAWQMFLIATVPSFGFCRKAGESEITITSIGTGKGIKAEDPVKLKNKRAISWASSISDLFMVDALEMNQVIMNAFGKNIGDNALIDSQFGNMNDVNYYTKKLFSFQRFNVELSYRALKKLNFNFSASKVESLQQMDHFENIDYLLEIGRRYSNDLKFNI